MKLKIPYIPSRGFECGQACVAMAIKYYYPKFEPDFDEFNTVIRHKEGKYTYPTQSVLLLDYYGVKAKIYSSKDLLTTLNEPGLFERIFKGDYEEVKNYLDNLVHDWAIIECKGKGLFKKQRRKFDDLLNMVADGKVVIIPIDLNTLYNKKGSYDGHFVIITGVQGEYIFIHDPDEGPHIKYRVKDLQHAWEHPAIDNDVTVCFGPKPLK